MAREIGKRELSGEGRVPGAGGAAPAVMTSCLIQSCYSHHCDSRDKDPAL
jgi:hypothetical protein